MDYSYSADQDDKEVPVEKTESSKEMPPPAVPLPCTNGSIAEGSKVVNDTVILPNDDEKSSEFEQAADTVMLESLKESNTGK